MIRGIWSHRHLLFALVRRQILLRYRQSFVGYAWAIIPPLGGLVTATLVFHKVAGIDSGRIPYPAFAFAALVPWSFFAGALSSGANSVVNGHAMLSRFQFPRAILPLSALGISLVDLAISGSLLVGFLYLTGQGLPITALWFPLLLLLEIVLASGFILLFSALNAFARDIRLGLPMLIQLWLFLTPVMYPLRAVPSGIRTWYLLNPMTGLIESFRAVLLHGQGPELGKLFPTILGAAAALLIGSWYFAGTEDRFADVI